MSFIFLGIRYFTSSPLKADCEIYKVLTAEIYASDWGYVEVFKPYILPLNDPKFENRISWVSAVTHRTNQKKVVPASNNYDSYEVFITEEVGVDLSAKNWTLSLEGRKNLGKCYARKDRPDISSLGLEALALREAVKPGTAEAWPNIWRLSEIIRSDDGQYAVIFSSSHCGGLCAWWGFYLLENKNQQWKVIGTHTEAVS